MGQLAAYRYPTNLFARLADHTYVSCGTGGKAWSCWGGKQGGTLLKSAPGSTKRADMIAEPDERAGITCYLVNGVCHQAANRILLPAGITVAGARGYSLSVSLFGPYGRSRGLLGLCKAPFNRHEGVSGDIAECLAATPVSGATQTTPDAGESAYLSEALQMERRMEATSESLAEEDAMHGLQMELFELFVKYKLGGLDASLVSRPKYGNLMLAREDFESKRLAAEQRFAEDRDAVEFADRFDELSIQFQHMTAEILDRNEYSALLDLEAGDFVTLADPEAVENAYRNDPRPGGRSP